jgi:hypothetical protein
MNARSSILLAGAAMLTAFAAAPGLATDAPATTAIAVGQTAEGEIAAGGGACVADPRIKLYSFTAAAHSRYEITLRADDFDTYVELGRLDGCTFTELASNDDGGGEDDGLNSRLVVNLHEAGTYVIRAKALADDGHGKFRLALRQLPAVAAAPAPVALTLGREVAGTLAIGDSTLPSDDATSVVDSGRPYRLYTLTGTAGEEVELRLMSDDFDSFLEVGSQSPLGFSVASSNDDGGEEGDNLNSRLRITFQTAGTVTVRVSPLGPDSGAYRLVAAHPTGPATPRPMVDGGH